MYRLVSRMPIGKGTGRFYTIEKDLDIESAIEIARDDIDFVIEELTRLRSLNVRSYKMLPKYLMFFIMKNGNPQFGGNRKVGEFRIWLDSGEVEIMKQWMT